MSPIIVDASVGLKWFLPEVYSAEARQWRSGTRDLHTPAVFFDIEIANILWKKTQRAELLPTDARQILVQLPLLPLARHPESAILSAAFELAAQTQRIVYDCLYLALAVQLGGQMVTADQRLYNSIAGTFLARHIAWVADCSSTP